MNREIVSTSKAPAAVGPYSQAVKAGDFLFASGQIPLDPSTGEITGDSIEEQTVRVCENINEVLKEAGLSFDNVVKTTCFLADMKYFGAFNEIYGKYFKNNPARSCVAVKEIPRGALCEIEIIAVF